MLERSASLSHPRRKVLHTLSSSIAGSRNHGPRSFRRDFWYCCREKNWPIADRRVPSNNPRNNCRKHFGSSSLLVFPFRAEFSGIYWKHVVFHIRTVAGGPTLRPRRCLVLRPCHTLISVNRPAGLLLYSFVAAQSEAIVLSLGRGRVIRKVVGPLQNRDVAFSTVTPVERKKAVTFFLSSIIRAKTKIGKRNADKGREKATGTSC